MEMECFNLGDILCNKLLGNHFAVVFFNFLILEMIHLNNLKLKKILTQCAYICNGKF